MCRAAVDGVIPAHCAACMLAASSRGEAVLARALTIQATRLLERLSYPAVESASVCSDCQHPLSEHEQDGCYFQQRLPGGWSLCSCEQVQQ